MEYKHLYFRNGHEIPFIRYEGILTRISAASLGIDLRANKDMYGSIDDLAEDRSLPIEAVREAIHWFDEHQEVVIRELTRERQEAGLSD